MRTSWQCIERASVAAVIVVLSAAPARAQAPVAYRIEFPEPEHRWAQVEVLFSDVAPGQLEVRMSRTSPGRYALHEFAKNVYDVEAVDGAGRAVPIERPNPHQWNIRDHDGTVRMRYRLFGDRTDGTYTAIDTTHAHLSMPATFMWARGLEDRPIVVQFVPPDGSGWRVATQLFPTDDPMRFSAPNLQYFFDSPTELSDFTLRTFRLREADRTPTFRVALHHRGTDAQADAYARDAERIVREAEAVYGELPPFDAGTYTFIADYLPYASGDGMEHRNSTVLTSSGALGSPQQRRGLVGTVAHEFFHAWNVERIRPASLEPFDFEAANMSGELWLAEGFTSYYGTLLMRRAGLTTLEGAAASFAGAINTVTVSPGRRHRSAVEMSRQAPFVDAARSVDRTNRRNTFISYYTWGSAIALGLDLSLRVHTGGRVSLDDYMRAMWETHGRQGGRPGYVNAPYDLEAARARLIEVSGDRAFADDFFARYVAGHEVVDYAALLKHAGLVVRPRARAWLGFANFQFDASGATLTSVAAEASPFYRAGVERDDLVVSLDGEAMTSAERFEAVRARHRPGDAVPIEFVRRGRSVKASVTFDQDPRINIVPVESDGARLADAERAFRDAWLGTKVTKVQ